MSKSYADGHNFCEWVIEQKPKKPLYEDGCLSAPDATLPLCAYKSKLFPPKLKAYHHFLTESFHPHKGDKPKINRHPGKKYKVRF